MVASSRPRRSLRVAALAALIAGALLVAGCGGGPGVEWSVEEATTKTGENLTPLNNEILRDARKAVDIWIKHPDRIEEAFTGSALQEFRAARTLDKKDGIRVVRVHKNQRFQVLDINEGVRPYVEYRFLDMSYYVDAKTGKAKTKPFKQERTLAIYMVRNDGVYKIDSMIGAQEAIR